MAEEAPAGEKVVAEDGDNYDADEDEDADDDQEQNDEPLLFDSSRPPRKRRAHRSTQPQEEQQPQHSCSALMVLVLVFLLLLLMSGKVLTGAARQYFRENGDAEDAFVLSLVAATAPYLGSQLIMGALAVLSRSSGALGRWVMGYICVVSMSTYKTAVLVPALFPDDDKATPGYLVLFVYATTALMECSNASLIFGGRKLQNRFGIFTYRRAFLTALVPCQAKFVEQRASISAGEEEGPRKGCLAFSRSMLLAMFCKSTSGDDRTRLHMQRFCRTSTRTVHLAVGMSLGLLLRLLLRSFDGAVVTVLSSNVILEAEALAVVMSCFVLFCDVPGHLMQVVVDLFVLSTSMRPSLGPRRGGEGLDAVATDEETAVGGGTCCSDSGTATGRGTFFRDLEELRVILPFGAVFLSTSSRQFWGRWSRPASQLVRLLIYYPIVRWVPRYVAIILLFAINSTAHYHLGQSKDSWNTVFGVLAVAALVEVAALDYLDERYPDIPRRRSFRVCLWAFTHASLITAAYVLTKGCFGFGIGSI